MRDLTAPLSLLQLSTASPETLCSWECLLAITAAGEYSSVADLLSRNCDYIVDSVAHSVLSGEVRSESINQY